MSFEKTLDGLNKDMANEEKKYRGQVAKLTKNLCAQYTVYGYALALQYWAFEAIPTIGALCSEYKGRLFPRMLSWELQTALVSKEINYLLNKKNVS